jgi:hypothetical protein
MTLARRSGAEKVLTVLFDTEYREMIDASIE